MLPRGGVAGAGDVQRVGEHEMPMNGDEVRAGPTDRDNERCGTPRLPESRGVRGDPEASDHHERVAQRYVLAVVMPLWIASGSFDYVLHRRARIERNAGTYESRLHLLGIGMSAAPVLAGLVFEINAGVIAIMAIGYIAHLAMTIWDVAYADGKRTIVPLEQHVHALLELLPFTALSLVLCTHEEQALALVGRGSVRPDFRLRRKRVPIARRSIAAMVIGFTLFVALPFSEELLRCLRYERAARSSSSPARDAPPDDALPAAAAAETRS